VIAFAKRARIKTILRDEEFAEPRGKEIDPNQTPRTETSLQHVVDVFGLVATMERPNANVRQTYL